MKLRLEYGEEHGTSRGEDVFLRVVLTSREDPGSPENAEALALEAFREWLSDMVDRKVFDEAKASVCAGVWLEEGHVVTFESKHGLRVRKAQGRVMGDVARLARTGARPGPVGRGEGEWVFSRRTGFWTLTAELYRHGNAD